MKTYLFVIVLFLALFASCTSQKKLAYLNNLPTSNGEATFNMEIPDYKIQPRDILYITVKAMTPDGTIKDFLSSSTGTAMNMTQGDAGMAFYGYNVNQDGNLIIPGIGQIKVSGLSLEEIRMNIQDLAEKIFRNSTVECKLLSFKYTVIGEVKAPGVYINYNNYLTILEAIGKAGGIGDFGDRSRVLIIRTFDKGTKTYRINIQDKNLINSEAYFLLPNDIVIIEPLKQKVFNLNLPTVSFIITTVTSVLTTTLLLINYFK
jgi:polysaccharide biosynthesis/export protein